MREKTSLNQREKKNPVGFESSNLWKHMAEQEREG